MNLVIVFSGQGLQKYQQLDELNTLINKKERDLFYQRVADIAENNIFDNKIAQPFIFALQYHRYCALRQAMEMPMVLAGYSLGEVSAWCCSMNVGFEEGLDVAINRARVMQACANEGDGLVSVQGLNSHQIKALIGNTDTHLSIKQSETQYIIAGRDNDLNAAQQLAEQMGAKHIKRLKVAIASHSPLMGVADERFLAYLQTQDLPNMTIPIISATDATKYDDNAVAKRLLSEQITHSLDWQMCMSAIREHQPDVVLEIGPGNALTKLMAVTMPDVPCRSYDDFADERGVVAWLKNHQ